MWTTIAKKLVIETKYAQLILKLTTRMDNEIACVYTCLTDYIDSTCANDRQEIDELAAYLHCLRATVVHEGVVDRESTERSLE